MSPYCFPTLTCTYSTNDVPRPSSAPVRTRRAKALGPQRPGRIRVKDAVSGCGEGAAGPVPVPSRCEGCGVGRREEGVMWVGSRHPDTVQSLCHCDIFWPLLDGVNC